MKLKYSEAITTGWLKVFRRIYEHQGAEVVREVVETGDAVAVLPYNADTMKVMLVRQFRAPVNGLLVEAVAGMIDEGETPAEACVRELFEETGLKLDEGDLAPVGDPNAGFLASPGLLTQRKFLFTVPYNDADKLGAGGGLESENEDLEVLEMDFDDFFNQLAAGHINDIKTYVLGTALKDNLKEALRT